MNAARWTGRILSALSALFLFFDGAMKLVREHHVIEASARMGWPDASIRWLGVALVGSTILYAVPRTAVLGAILLTGYLGGATATHVRAGEPFVFPVVFGVIVWLGLFLREGRVRALLPLRAD